MLDTVKPLPRVVDQVLERGVEGEGAALLVQPDEEIWKQSICRKPVVKLSLSLRWLKTRKAVDSRVLTFAGPPDVPDDVDVGLLPELVALAEVAAEVVLVLHHVAGDGQADGRGSGRGQHTRQPVLPAGVVVAGLKQGKVKIFPQV